MKFPNAKKLLLEQVNMASGNIDYYNMLIGLKEKSKKSKAEYERMIDKYKKDIESYLEEHEYICTLEDK